MGRLGEFKIGDYREMLQKRLKIVGISEEVKSFTTTPIIFTSYKVAMKVKGG